MPSLLRKGLLGVLLLALLFVLLYKLRGGITLEGFRWSVLAGTVRGARHSLLLLSIFAIYVCYAIRALRWMRFSRYIGAPSFSPVYNGTLMGFASLFLLGRIGEPIRPLLIARKGRLPVSSTFGIYVLERVTDIAATAVLAGLALLIFARRGMPGEESSALFAHARTAGAVLIAGVTAAIAFLVYFRYQGAAVLTRRLQAARTNTGWRAKCVGLFTGFSEGLQSIRTWADLFWAVVYTFAHWLLVAWIYLWISHAFRGELGTLDFSGALLVLAFTMVGSTVQLPGVGGGAQLATFLVFTTIFGVEKEPAAAAAITLWLITFAASCIAGVPLLIREGWSMGELLNLARAEAVAESAGQHANPARKQDKPEEKLR
jgi:glycosyltransferase 2 family protein